MESALAHRGNRQEQSQYNTTEGSEEHLEVAGQAERERVRGDPEQGDGLLENEIPLHLPVHLLDEPAHLDGTQKTDCLAVVGGDVHVANLVERHEDGREGGVHHHADEEGTHQFQPGKATFHGLADAAKAGSFLHKGRYADFENAHGQRNPHAEEAPDDEFREEAEALVIILSRLHTLAQHLAERGQDAKLQEGHPQRIISRKRAKCVIHRFADKKRKQHHNHYGKHKEIDFFH